MRKIFKMFMFLIIFACTFVGCSCGDKETPEEKKLRLYDCNKNGVIDYWEEPFNYEVSPETTNVDRSIYDKNGEEITTINRISSTSDLDKLVTLANQKTKTTLEFTDGVFFQMSNEQYEDLIGFRAYIVYIYSADDLVKFANKSMDLFDSDKYIIKFENNIDFRNSNGEFQEHYMINVNGATILGNGKTIEGFKLVSNNNYVTSGKEVGVKQLDTLVNDTITNLKYSIISNASAVYDLNIYLGYNNLQITPKSGMEVGNYNATIDIAPLRNCGVLDNVYVRGYLGANTHIVNTGFGTNNTGFVVKSVNISGVVSEEDEMTGILAYDSVTNDPTEVVAGTIELLDNLEFVIDEANKEAKKDFDRLRIKYLTQEKNEHDEYVPVVKYRYGDVIKNTKVLNTTSELAVSMDEPLKSDGSRYDACVEFNFGGVIANKYKGDNIVNNTKVIIPQMTVLTGGDANIGGIFSTAENNMFAENCYTNIGTAETPIKITPVDSTFTNVGGAVGCLNEDAEIKNCTSEIYLDYVGNVITEASETQRVSSVSAGTIAGVNNSIIVSNKGLGSINVQNANMSTIGAIAGSSKNGQFIKNISQVTGSQTDNFISYSGSLVGNIIGGFVSHNIIGYSDVINQNSAGSVSEIVADNGNINLKAAFSINSGLLFFQSEAYISYLNEKIQENNGTLTKDKAEIDVSKDSFYRVDNTNIYTNTHLMNYEPMSIANLINDNTHINYTLKEEGEEEVPTELVGVKINLGGYHLGTFGIYNQINDSLSYIMSDNINEQNSVSGLYINNSNRIVFKERKQNNEVETTTKNFIGTDNGRLFGLNKDNSLNLNKIRDRVPIIGVDKNNTEELIAYDADVSNFRNLAFNNVYQGRYYSPDKFTDVQMSDTTVCADFIIDSMEEFKYILNNFLEPASNVHRKELFKKLIFKLNDIISKTDGKDNFDVKDLVWSADSQDGYKKRYERDKNGNLKTTSKYLYMQLKEGSTNEYEESISDEFIFLEKVIDGNPDPSGIRYAVKRGDVTRELSSDSSVQYKAPEGYAIIVMKDGALATTDSTATPAGALECGYNPVQLLITSYFAKLAGVKYVTYITDTTVEDNFARTTFNVIYKDEEQKNNETFVLQSLYSGEEENFNTYYMLYKAS